VFVTGVPGAGKTLVGLNVATRHGSRDDAALAVFLSGNGPLVTVLREALARDDLDRRKNWTGSVCPQTVPVPFSVLKPHAIDIRVNIDPVHWFLSPPRDTRSSLYLEDAATEFQVQGLELDWTKSHVGRRLTLEWERLELSQFLWGPKDETSRTDVKKPERRQYLKNASLVLLTRAQPGMVIFVPPGAKRDRTRSPAFYEGIHDYLTGMGVAEI
jgi:hypothetical protein